MSSPDPVAVAARPLRRRHGDRRRVPPLGRRDLHAAARPGETARAARADRDAGTLSTAKTCCTGSVQRRAWTSWSIDTVLFLAAAPTARRCSSSSSGARCGWPRARRARTVSSTSSATTHREFRFASAASALTGVRRTEVVTEVKRVRGSRPPPAGCHIDLDREVSRLVLANLRATISTLATIVSELRRLPEDTTLAGFLSGDRNRARRPLSGAAVGLVGPAAHGRARLPPGPPLTSGSKHPRARPATSTTPKRLYYHRPCRGGAALLRAVEEQRLLAMLETYPGPGRACGSITRPGPVNSFPS